MPILNYTTGVAVDKTATEIQKILAQAGAIAIMFEYEGAAVITHINFRMNTPQGTITFRLPGNVDGVFQALQKEKKVEKRYKTREQASRVAWRIIKDWVEAQLAIIQAEMATAVQVFLPYAQCADGDTVYEMFEKKSFTALTGPG